MMLGRTKIRESVGVLPAVAVYLVSEWCGIAPVIALGVSIAVAVAGLGWPAWRGRLSRMHVVSVVLFAAIATAVSVTGDAWLFLLKPVATGLVLGALILANPGRGGRAYSLSILSRLRPRRREQLLHDYENDPGIRRRHYTVTRAWGIAVVADGLIRAIALLTLPPWLAVLTSMPLTFAAAAAGTAVSLRYLSAAATGEHTLTRGD